MPLPPSETLSFPLDVPLVSPRHQRHAARPARSDFFTLVMTHEVRDDARSPTLCFFSPLDDEQFARIQLARMARDRIVQVNPLAEHLTLILNAPPHARISDPLSLPLTVLLPPPLRRARDDRALSTRTHVLEHVLLFEFDVVNTRVK